MAFINVIPPTLPGQLEIPSPSLVRPWSNLVNYAVNSNVIFGSKIYIAVSANRSIIPYRGEFDNLISGRFNRNTGQWKLA